jgi:hypothetical protein
MATPTITITAYSVPGQAKSTVKLTKTGSHKGTASVDGTNYNLTDVKASNGGLKLTCTAQVLWGINVTSTIEPSAPPANSTITIQAAILTLHYQIDPDDEQKLVDFLKTNFA